MIDIKESDWKYLRNLKKVLLDRLCNRILDDIRTECGMEKREQDAHEQYLKVYDLIETGDRMIAECFDDWRRSNIILHIVFLIKHQVIAKDEIDQLSDETKERLKFHLDN